MGQDCPAPRQVFINRHRVPGSFFQRNSVFHHLHHALPGGAAGIPGVGEAGNLEETSGPFVFAPLLIEQFIDLFARHVQVDQIEGGGLNGKRIAPW